MPTVSMLQTIPVRRLVPGRRSHTRCRSASKCSTSFVPRHLICLARSCEMLQEWREPNSPNAWRLDRLRCCYEHRHSRACSLAPRKAIPKAIKRRLPQPHVNYYNSCLPRVLGSVNFADQAIANGAEVFAALCLVCWCRENVYEAAPFRNRMVQRCMTGLGCHRYKAKELETALQASGPGVVLKTAAKRLLHYWQQVGWLRCRCRCTRFVFACPAPSNSWNLIFTLSCHLPLSRRSGWLQSRIYLNTRGLQPSSAACQALLRDGFEQCVDDVEKRCFEQQDKLQAPPAQPCKAGDTDVEKLCRLSFWEALPTCRVAWTLCRTSAPKRAESAFLPTLSL